MNVAITRARSSLFIVGNGPTLERSNDVWSNIVNDARERQCYVELVSFPFPVNHSKDLISIAE